MRNYPYTVKMTKGDQVYSESLKLVLDPRVKFTLEDRKAQFDLAMKLYNLLGHMSYAVNAIEAVRDGANARTARLGEKDPLRAQLQQLATDSDQRRSKMVATKEGGAITGEERIREHLGELYGAVDRYEGRPTDQQAARTDALARELDDVIHDLQRMTGARLPALNAALQKKKLDPIRVPTEAEWEQQHQAGASAPAATAGFRELD